MGPVPCLHFYFLDCQNASSSSCKFILLALTVQEPNRVAPFVSVRPASEKFGEDCIPRAFSPRAGHFQNGLSLSPAEDTVAGLIN